MSQPIFPLAVLDFEASSLDPSSYPIEVGVAVARTADAQIETWSTLIRPHPSWREGGDWGPQAQAVHGITPAMLAEGMDPEAVLTRLNQLLETLGHAWVDGGRYDLHWFQRLCEAAPAVRPAFHLRDLSGLFVLDRRAHNRFADALAAAGEPPHRAGPDAARVCAALVASFCE